MPLLFMLLLSVFHAVPVFADAEEREQCQLAVAEEVSGTVEVIGPDGNKVALVADGAVQPGDLVRTGAGAWADLRLCDGTGLRVGESSKFYYESADNEQESFAAWAFRLVSGSLRAAVVSSGTSERVKLRVRTTSASLGVRGTEFVVDAADDGDRETALHTVEGEVLMGSEADFDKLGKLHGQELTRSFEPVGKEQMSVIRRNESRPMRAAAFKLWEFRTARQRLFGRPLPKKGWTELRERFRAVHQRLRKRRQERGLFERQREKLEEKVEDKRPDRALRRQERAASRGEEPSEAMQDKKQKVGRFAEQRRKRLEENLEQNQQGAMDKRLHKGWRKNLQNQAPSPRAPRFGR